MGNFHVEEISHHHSTKITGIWGGEWRQNFLMGVENGVGTIAIPNDGNVVVAEVGSKNQ